MRLIVNLPAFNEEEKIAETIKRIPRQIEGVDEVLVQVIDDGSKDKTIEVAKAAGADFVYTNGLNRGIGITFKHAVERALDNGADIMCNMDADGQFNPQDIGKIIGPVLKKEADMVSATRFGDKEAKDMPKAKYYLNLVAAKIIGNFMNYAIDDLTCGFRAYSRETMIRLNITPGFTYTQETIIDAIGKNLKLKWVPVEVTYFAGRKSRVVKSIFNYVSNSGKIILEAVRDVRPMKFFGWPAIILLLASLGFFIDFFVLYFSDFKITPHRNVLFAGITLLIVGVQFLIFAFIADMIKSARKLIEDQAHTLKKWRYKK
ncbi:MAG: glycosyltransferase family 2 protein [Candidatus Moraniibacteriota bacterium]